GGEAGLERRVEIDERAGDAVAHRARLPGFPAAMDVGADVEHLRHVGHLQRLAHDHAAALTGEIAVHVLAVDHDPAGAAPDEDPGDGCLAAAGPVVVFADHVFSVAFGQICRGFGCWAAWGCV